MNQWKVMGCVVLTMVILWEVSVAVTFLLTGNRRPGGVLCSGDCAIQRDDMSRRWGK